MSRLNDLIKELCPNGVEYKKLGDVADIVNGYSFKSSVYSLSGIRVIRISDVQKGYISNDSLKYYPQEYLGRIGNAVLRSGDLVMSLTGNVGRVAMITSDVLPAGLNQRVACVRVKDPSEINNRYLYYFLGQNAFEQEAVANSKGGGQKNMSTVWLGNYCIPLPPLKIQQEIVKILDKFTQLQAELQAELELRSRQYEHYRDGLLSFDNLSKLAGGVIRKIKLGDAGHFFGGLTGKTSDDFDGGNAKFVTYSGLFNNLAIDESCLGVVNVGEDEKQNALRAGDVLFTGSSETPEEVAYSSVVTKDLGTVYLNSFCFGYRMDNARVLDPEFAKHLFRSKWVRKQLVKTAMGVTRFNVSKERMKRVEIVIPDISTQRRIAVSLDKFWLYVTGLSDGLPAEIKLRQQQYEYYRDELLSFKLTNV